MQSSPEKTVTIYVEGAPHPWPKNQAISYAEVVALEVPDFSQYPERTYTVKYTRGHGEKPEGTLNAGGAPVKVKEEMRF